MQTLGTNTSHVLKIEQGTKRFRCARGHEWEELDPDVRPELRCFALLVRDESGREVGLNGVCQTCLASTILNHAGEFSGTIVREDRTTP